MGACFDLVLSVIFCKYLGDFLPSPNEDFSDIASEEALSDLAFYGIGQVYLERKPDEDTYQVDLTSLGSLQPK